MDEPARAFSLEESTFTVVEAARHLRISRSAFYELIRAHKIKISKIGTRTIVPGCEVARFISELAQQKRAP